MCCCSLFLLRSFRFLCMCWRDYISSEINLHCLANVHRGRRAWHRQRCVTRKWHWGKKSRNRNPSRRKKIQIARFQSSPGSSPVLVLLKHSFKTFVIQFCEHFRNTGQNGNIGWFFILTGEKLMSLPWNCSDRMLYSCELVNSGCYCQFNSKMVMC